jgi:hypothetical protein
MHVRASTLRGLGVEIVREGISVTPEVLKLSRYTKKLEIGTVASISIDELRAI